MYHPHFTLNQAYQTVFALALTASQRRSMAENCEAAAKAFDSDHLLDNYHGYLKFWNSVQAANKMTWVCNICGKERPNANIQVFRRDISEQFNLPPGSIGETVRYCNDSDDCIKKAAAFHHLKHEQRLATGRR